MDCNLESNYCHLTGIFFGNTKTCHSFKRKTFYTRVKSFHLVPVWSCISIPAGLYLFKLNSEVKALEQCVKSVQS